MMLARGPEHNQGHQDAAELDGSDYLMSGQYWLGHLFVETKQGVVPSHSPQNLEIQHSLLVETGQSSPVTTQ